MTDRGQQTLARLIEAARHVVREVGYANTTTRKIAAAAGVTEGTIYRHFPNKRALLVAAVLYKNPVVMDEVATLPSRAGQATVTENLVWALTRLATLREDLVPLELALLTEPELTGEQAGESDPRRESGLPAGGQPEFLSDYLAAEQALGRVRGDLDPGTAAVVLLSLLFALSLRPPESRVPVTQVGIDVAVDLVVKGLAVPVDRQT